MTVVTIWHNIATDTDGRPLGMLDGYSQGHPLVPVARYVAVDRADDDTILADAWFLFNVADDPDFGTPRDFALEYRSRQNRSLSTGDVISIQRDGEPVVWKACASVGWDPIEQPAWFAIGARAHGTTSIDRKLVHIS